MEQSVNIGYKVYNQAYKAGQVIKIQLSGYTGYSYFRVIGFAEDKPWAKLMYIGYKGNDRGGLPIVSSGSSPAYTNCVKERIYYTDPSSGQFENGYAVYYYNSASGFTGPDTFLESGANAWYTKLPSAIKLYIPSVALGGQEVYLSAFQTLASGFTADITVNPESNYNKWYVNKVSAIASTGISRHIFVPSIRDVIGVLGTSTPTAADIAANFLGAKHYGGDGTTQIKGAVGTALYDATIEQYSGSGEGKASDVGYYSGSGESTGGYINRNLGQGELMPTFYLNLRSFKKWELATDW